MSEDQEPKELKSIQDLQPKPKEGFIYVCYCDQESDDPEAGMHFMIMSDGYECVSCGKFHTFEQVHGSID